LRGQESRKASLEQQRVYLKRSWCSEARIGRLLDTGERIGSTADRLKLARSQLDSGGQRTEPITRMSSLERQVDGLGNMGSTAIRIIQQRRRRQKHLRRRLENHAGLCCGRDGRYVGTSRIVCSAEVDALQAQLAAAPARAVPTSASRTEGGR